jgi:hypothetical protein
VPNVNVPGDNQKVVLPCGYCSTSVGRLEPGFTTTAPGGGVEGPSSSAVLPHTRCGTVGVPVTIAIPTIGESRCAPPSEP